MLLAATAVVLWLLAGCRGGEGGPGAQQQEADGSDCGNQQLEAGQGDSHNYKLVFVSGFYTSPHHPTEVQPYVVNADGTSLTRLTKTTAHEYGLANRCRLAGGREATITWTADGKKIARIAYKFGYSPNGKKIVFVGPPPSSTSSSASPRAEPSTDIYVKSANDNSPSRLTNTPEVTKSDPVWSPDGKRIAYTREMFDKATSSTYSQIYVMNADGSDQRNLTHSMSSASPTSPWSASSLRSAFGPVWAPDGEKIAFESGEDNNIYLINADGTGLTLLPTGGPAVDLPMFSPDGKKIAFVRGEFATGRPAEYYVYVINIDGTGLTRLSNNAASKEIVTWVSSG